jgi:Uma2 family endonuclease
VATGEAGFVLCRDPETLVGVDVAYVAPDVIARTAPDAAYYEGPPTLAVEVLSPSDLVGGVDGKVRLYLEHGVAVIWVVSPTFRTITVYRPDALPVLFNAEQEIAAEPHLPGFRVRVATLFE